MTQKYTKTLIFEIREDATDEIIIRTVGKDGRVTEHIYAKKEIRAKRDSPSKDTLVNKGRPSSSYNLNLSP
jgi:hypothetical protein